VQQWYGRSRGRRWRSNCHTIVLWLYCREESVARMIATLGKQLDAKPKAEATFSIGRRGFLVKKLILSVSLNDYMASLKVLNLITTTICSRICWNLNRILSRFSPSNVNNQHLTKETRQLVENVKDIRSAARVQSHCKRYRAQRALLD
jgi:hypothetical protein